VEALLSQRFLNWTSRVAIAGRIAEHRRPHDTGELTTPGDYHLPREVAVAGLHHLKDRTALPFGSAVSGRHR